MCVVFLFFFGTKFISLFGRYNISIYTTIGTFSLFQILIVFFKYYFDILFSKYFRFS